MADKLSVAADASKAIVAAINSAAVKRDAAVVAIQKRLTDIAKIDPIQ